MRGTPVRRGILALDIEGFGQPSRTDPQRAQLRSRLHALLDHALEAAEIPLAHVAARSDLGDGILVLFDPAVSAATLLHPLLSHLAAQLAADNQPAASPARLRLRVAVHEGHVLADQHGYTGEDLNHTFRLLDAHATRTVLAGSPSAASVLVVSDAVYQGIVQHRYAGVDPAGWQPIRIHAKETRTRAWARLPGLARQPDLPAVLAAPPVGPATVPIPRELPAPPAAFTGRTGELQQLARLLDVPAGAAGGPVVISAIDGMGGIGKSALAIQAAHRLAGQFPDGQLYVNLHGATPGHPPVVPLDALGRILRSLGVDPAAVPLEVEEAAARWRSLAADRRLLVVLDDAGSSEQVRPLLPASPACAALVTSRRVLATLDGTQPLHLDLLPADEAVELLAKLAGPERISADPQAAEEVVRRCGYLPLAVRIAGARLAARPTWPVGKLTRRLQDATRRLDELTVDGLEVRAAFDVSLAALQDGADPIDQAAAAAFGLLSLPDGPDLDVVGASRLLDLPEPTSETLLERLVDAQLLEAPRPGRYQFHDLVRLYARQHATTTHSKPERLAALERLWGFYAATAWRTRMVQDPGNQRAATADLRWAHGGLGLDDIETATRWLETERANLLAAVPQAARAAPAIPATLACELASALWVLFETHGYWHDGVQTNQTALALARRTGDRAAQAHGLNDLGVIHQFLGRDAEAIACLQAGLALCRDLGDRWGQATSLNRLGVVQAGLGRFAEAIACLEEGLALRRASGDRHDQASSLAGLGQAYGQVGRYAEAIACLQEGLALSQALRNRWHQAQNLHGLGVVQGRLGRFTHAVTSLQEALRIFSELGHRAFQADILERLGTAFGELGQFPQAIASLRESLALRRELGDRHGQVEALRHLAEALRAVAQHREAQAAWQEALELCEALQIPEADEVRSRLVALPAEETEPETPQAPNIVLSG